MRVFLTKKVAPKRNRTTIKKIVLDEFSWNDFNIDDFTMARFYFYKFIGNKQEPKYALLVGVSAGNTFDGEAVELIVKGTNAHRLLWLLSNRYKRDKKAKGYKGFVKGGKPNDKYKPKTRKYFKKGNHAAHRAPRASKSF